MEKKKKERETEIEKEKERENTGLPNVRLNMDATHGTERTVEFQYLTRFKAKFQNNLQMWDLAISRVGLLILAYLAF